jgi:thiamine biosynthesis lipoprotein
MVPGITRTVFGAMGCQCEVVIAGMSEMQATDVARVAIDEVRRIETKYSRYHPHSLLSCINAASGSHAIDCDAETMQLLAKADLLYRSSNGLFDITSGILRRCWDFKEKRLPLQSALDAVLPLIDWHAVEIGKNSVFLSRAGMEIDFGGFGKEYAADQAAGLLMAAGTTHGYVNLAGDFRVLGPRPDGSPWQIGIRHPRRDTALCATIPMTAGALATSGDYERFFDLNGRRYCHIFNPLTGYPVNYWQSVSVLAPNTLLAGSISSIAMLLEAEGLDFLHESGLGFMAVDGKGRVHHDELQTKAACTTAV